MAHQRRGEDTRAHILAAAADCFTRAGYDATGVAEISRGPASARAHSTTTFPASRRRLWRCSSNGWRG